MQTVSKPQALLYFPLNIYRSQSGIANKCRGIEHAFRDNFEVDCISASDSGLFWNQQSVLNNHSTGWRRGLFKLTDRSLGSHLLFRKYLLRKQYQLVYLRLHYFITPSLIGFFYLLRKRNPDIFILVEIPTFPFTAELYNRAARWRYRLGTFLLPIFRKLVHAIVTVSPHTTIFDIPAIGIRNGYYSETSVSGLPAQHLKADELHIGMVANFNFWHGPDLLIQSFIRWNQANPNPSRPVYLHMIGDGEILSSCQQQIAEAGLQDKVHFYGRIEPADIRRLSATIHIMTGTLGHHRKNIRVDSSLKSREYAFLGKPLILKTPDPDFPADWPFACYFPDDESLLDLDIILQFMHQLETRYPDYAVRIRQYAEQKLSWTHQLQPVFDAANKHLSEKNHQLKPTE